MKRVYIAPTLERIEFINTDSVNLTLNQSAVFNGSISSGIGENSAYRVFGVGKEIDF